MKIKIINFKNCNNLVQASILYSIQGFQIFKMLINQRSYKFDFVATKCYNKFVFQRRNKYEETYKSKNANKKNNWNMLITSVLNGYWSNGFKLKIKQYKNNIS